MAEGSESFQYGYHFGSVSTSFSQLLFSNDHNLGLDSNRFSYFSSSRKPPKMLCFGGFDDDGGGSEEGEFFLLSEAATKCTPQNSGVTCSDSSSASSINNNNTINTVNGNNISSDVSKSSTVRKRNGKCQETVQCTKKETKTDGMNQKACKTIKTESLKSPGNAKVRKEKLGDRIAALQQLVSPYGKTDTASVLHEAMGYIRFLHDQVQVLCSPYLLHQPEGKRSEEDDPQKDLRSRGLCLVPLESTLQVANSNSADYWSPAMRGGFTWSPSTMKCQ